MISSASQATVTGDAPSTGRRRTDQHPKPGIRRWMLLVCLGLMIPILGLSVFEIVQIHEVRRASIEMELAQRSEAGALAVSTRLHTGLGYLESLATSDAARRGNLQELYEHAERVARKMPGLIGIGLMGADRTMVFMTSKPFGTALAKPPSSRMTETIFATGKPGVSGLFTGPYSGKKVVALGVPVAAADGSTSHCLFMVLTSESLSTLLQQQKLPEAWRVAIVDQNLNLVARNAGAEQYVGTPVAPAMHEFLAARKTGQVPIVMKEGQPSVAYAVRIPDFAWTLAMGVPEENIAAPLDNLLSMLALVSVIVFAAILLIVLATGKYLEAWIVRVVEAVDRIASGEMAQTPSIHIRELDDMAHSLIEAHHKKRRVGDQLSRTQHQNRHLTRERDEALVDKLTGLAGRQAFLQQVDALRVEALAQNHLTIGLLFIDVDELKAVNDRQGHQAGDALLARVGRILNTVAAGRHVAARWGGDEFVLAVLDHEIGMPQTLALIQDRILALMAQAEELPSASVGWAVWDAAVPDIDALIQRADTRMYAAKARRKQGQPDPRFIAMPAQQIWPGPTNPDFAAAPLPRLPSLPSVPSLRWRGQAREYARKSKAHTGTVAGI